MTRKKYFIEFFDIGGSSRYEVARGVFFDNPDGTLPPVLALPLSLTLLSPIGAIFVHDLSNKKSRTNLGKWVRELAMRLDPDSTFSWSKVREPIPFSLSCTHFGPRPMITEEMTALYST